MTKINFFLNDITQSNIYKKIKLKKIEKNFEKIFSEVKNDVNKTSNTLNILNKKFKFNFEVKDLQKFKKFKTIVLIGMGGSILGAEAIHNFLHLKIKKKFYFFNDLNIQKISNLKKKENLSKVLFIIISKSGNTIETLSNTFTLNIIKKNPRNIILISEKRSNSLFLLSKKLGIFFIEHKNFIGGRFSVLSEVGIIPAYFMGVNIIKLRSKILDCLNKNNKSLLKNNSLKLAGLMNSKKFNNIIFLNYSPELEKFLFWCQQLIAESLGKNNKGFLPVISNTPKDHHSLLQLYLDGPKDKFFYIFSLPNTSRKKIKISKRSGLKSFLNGKTLDQIKDAQKNALIKALREKKIPFREFKIKNISEEVLGNLFSNFIIETIIVGKLLRINPYDQPAVEQVKIFTKKILN